eukprot:CAMPEP_0170251320 /NCGR_PEP_ID=MMETSP0116_2-20130129/25489_1 /TAXON_ID=400756 /ORGANISM="Durinskia baltica, Strain CSIRO CS-38" /LENGTH=293 /DNA_ID=CAMNT_0010502281 /DNA_START=88 /DNA_END=966 /DNA_ORIENTATION=-
MAGRRLFVGSLPDGIADITLRATFQQYGHIETVFVKPDCEPGQQCAFVTFATPEQAMHAKASTDRVLRFPGAPKECEVMFARNQAGGPPRTPPAAAAPQPRTAAGAAGQATPREAVQPRKIHIGSLPDDISEEMLREEFARFGPVTDVHVRHDCGPGRKWAFVTFESPDDAVLAKECTDKELMFPGSIKPCEVVMARNQGTLGQQSPERAGASHVRPPHAGVAQGPRKLLIGSLPDDVTDEMLRETFGQYGTVVETFIKDGCMPGRQWAFVTFATATDAASAKIATDRILVMP